MVFKGEVEGIYVAAVRGAPTVAVPRAEARAGRGLLGDRHLLASGAATDSDTGGRQVTLIEAEAIEAIARDHGLDIGAGDARRNLVTRGVALNHLVGRRFVVGELLLEGTELCEPCVRLEQATVRGLLKALLHRGGLCARILRGGVVNLGDTVEPVARESP